jgi:hypothetical protein
MARTAITITALPANAGTAPAAGTAVDPTNGMSVAAGGLTRRLLLHIKATFAGAKNYTLKAGANPPAVRAGVGDLVLAINNAERFVVLEAARFVQADGTLNLDIEAGATGTIAAYRLGNV